MLMLTFTVRSSTTSTLVIGENTMGNSGPATPGTWPRNASRFSLTASAFSGVPSWNVIPSRTVIVHWV
jgi:hypothetical protein